jgi:DNA adenine methylase
VRALLRWAGSKRRLLKLLLGRLPQIGGRYIEPFAGSACLFFALEPTQAILGDINRELIETYRVLRHRPRTVWTGLTRAEQSEREYYRLRSLDPRSLSPMDRTVRFLYLNRFCFNGVYRTNRHGEFNVPRGKNTGQLPDLARFQDCAKLLRRVIFKNADFEETLAGVEATDFIYLDPPYFKPGRVGYGEYGYARFQQRDVSRLLGVLSEIDRAGARFLMSYSGTGIQSQRLGNWNVTRLQVRRYVAGFAAGRDSVTELLVSNY